MYILFIFLLSTVILTVYFYTEFKIWQIVPFMSRLEIFWEIHKTVALKLMGSFVIELSFNLTTKTVFDLSNIETFYNLFGFCLV